MNKKADERFAPQTIVSSLPGGIQIIVASAPQVSLVVELSIDQLKEALEKCLQLRTQQQLLDPAAVQALLRKGA